MKEYEGDKDFIELVDKAIKPTKDDVSRWSKVVIASHTIKELQKPEDIVLCMTLGLGLLFGALTDYDSKSDNNIICICQACKFLGVTEDECWNNEDLGEIQKYLKAHYVQYMKSTKQEYTAEI